MILAFGAQEILQAVSFPPLLREARASVPSSASLSRLNRCAVTAQPKSPSATCAIARL